MVGVVYYVLVWRTRFGFDLRAIGWQPVRRGRASGVDARAMIIIAMVLSGAIAGLVGLNTVLSSTGYYSADVVVAGLGFTGIAIALLGRNNPVGIAFGALLWAFMDVLQTPLGPGRAAEGDRPDHAGDHRAVGGDRLRGDPAARRSAAGAGDRDRAAAGQVAPA